MTKIQRLGLALGLALAAFGGAPAAAHDFWLQPATFWATPDAPTPIVMWVGHGADRAKWGVDSSRVLQFGSLGPDGKKDHRSVLPPGPLRADAVLRFAAAGLHIVTLESSHAKSNLPAAKFNAYLAEEGLTPALKQREANGAAETPGREIYSRRAKVLMRVGPQGAGPDVTRPIGLTLEIVPGRNPYDLKDGEPLTVQVIYEGAPLAGALVKLTNLDFDSQPVETELTDPAGHAAFLVPPNGIWQLNVVWTKPISGNADGDFDTTFSSLTFGFLPEPKS